MTEDFAEFGDAFLHLGDRQQAHHGEVLRPGAARPAENHSAIIEFRVRRRRQVDKEYERLDKVIGDFVQRPTTMPWGNRSLLFRDPDGNLINFFTPVTADARKRFDT